MSETSASAARANYSNAEARRIAFRMHGQVDIGLARHEAERWS